MTNEITNDGGQGSVTLTAPSAVALTPMEMIRSAVASGATPEMIDKLMSLQERWEKNEALKAFNIAVADAKAEIKPIVRNRTGHNNKGYADMAAVANGVDAILGNHGLSYRHKSRQDDKIHVTCILFHRLGHSEETTLSAKADNTGSKNDVQAIGSTAEYLKRYTLGLALGLASADADDDGAAAGAAETIDATEVEELQRRLFAIGGGTKTDALVKGFLKKFKIAALGDLPKTELKTALAALDARAREAEKP